MHSHLVKWEVETKTMLVAHFIASPSNLTMGMKLVEKHGSEHVVLDLRPFFVRVARSLAVLITSREVSTKNRVAT